MEAFSIEIFNKNSKKHPNKYPVQASFKYIKVRYLKNTLKNFCNKTKARDKAGNLNLITHVTYANKKTYVAV